MDLHRTSIEVIRMGQHPSGAYVASPTFPTYQYSWIRDGSFIAYGMDQAGQHESARAFHRWVSRAVVRYRSKVEALEARLPAVLDDNMVLHTRFTLEGEEGAEWWSNYQLDEYGFWLSALALHLAQTGSDPAEFLPATALTVRYLTLLWERPCYDCWEEHPQRRHPTTVAAIAAGLRHAAPFLEDQKEAPGQAARAIEWIAANALADGALTKFEADQAVDASSLLVLGPFGPFSVSDPVVARTVDRVEAQLVAEGGGVHRFAGDEYYGGGLWLPLAGALAWIHAELGNPSRAAEVLRWIEGTADDRGCLAEQVSRDLMVAERERYWVVRWGQVANPLLWSHGMYLTARARVGP